MIYEIVCNETGERYIGSTFETTLARRLSGHKCESKKNITTKSKQIIDRGNYYINLLQKVDVNTRDELRMKEREWIDKLDCINKIKRPFITKEESLEYLKEYRKQNITKIKEQTKEYYHTNKEKINARRKEMYALKKCNTNN